MSEEKYTAGDITDEKGETIGFYKIQWVNKAHPVHFIIEDKKEISPIFKSYIFFTSKMPKKLIKELLE